MSSPQRIRKSVTWFLEKWSCSRYLQSCFCTTVLRADTDLTGDLVASLSSHVICPVSHRGSWFEKVTQACLSQSSLALVPLYQDGEPSDTVLFLPQTDPGVHTGVCVQVHTNVGLIWSFSHPCSLPLLSFPSGPGAVLGVMGGIVLLQLSCPPGTTEGDLVWKRGLCSWN